jgi:hypothetical protein
MSVSFCALRFGFYVRGKLGVLDVQQSHCAIQALHLDTNQRAYANNSNFFTTLFIFGIYLFKLIEICSVITSAIAIFYESFI